MYLVQNVGYLEGITCGAVDMRRRWYRHAFQTLSPLRYER